MMAFGNGGLLTPITKARLGFPQNKGRSPILRTLLKASKEVPDNHLHGKVTFDDSRSVALNALQPKTPLRDGYYSCGLKLLGIVRETIETGVFAVRM
jgi:hypothetical protein